MNNILFLDVIFLGNLQDIVEAGTGPAIDVYKLLIMLIFIENMIPIMPNLGPN